VAQAAGLKDQLVIGGRTRAEHTENMYPMFVTLDVSRLSDWLNVFADCRVEREAWEEGGMQAGGRGGGGGGVECARKRVGSIQVEGWAGAAPHVKHPAHARDFGRVETQRLVERRRILPSPKGGIP
jgi:hypothetical protein